MLASRAFCPKSHWAHSSLLTTGAKRGTIPPRLVFPTRCECEPNDMTDATKSYDEVSPTL